MAAKKKSGHPLFHDGAGKVAGTTYGVLRTSYNGAINTASGYVASKLAVVNPAATNWQVSRRYDVVMPQGAPDMWWQPQALWRAYDEAVLGHQRDLIIALTCYVDDGFPIHAGWEQARAWVREALVEQRHLAAMMILHLPSAAGSANAPHVHILASARQALGWGFGGFAKETNDDGVRQLAEDYVAHRKAWVGGGRA